MNNPNTPEAAQMDELVDRSSEYRAVSSVFVTGATAVDGTPYVHITSRYSDHPGVWVSLDDLSTNQAEKRLRENGIYLFGDNLKRALEEAQKVTSFPPMPLIARPGWTGNHFALPSGEVISPKGSEPATVLFDVQPKKCGRKGKLKSWKAGVNELATGQSILMFVLMIAFAGPLLKLSRILENFGFELCGDGGVGKTSAQQLAASVLGGAIEAGGANYWITANATVNGLEQLYPEHADLAMIIDEMSDFCNGDTERVRATKNRELIFRLRSGTAKTRFDRRKEEPTRFVYLTSTNVSLAILFSGLDAATSAAAADRLLTIPISSARKHGIFDRLPDGCANGSEAISRLQALIQDHHGHAIQRFLKRLVKERARDEDALKRKIDAGIVRFRDAVGVDENVGSEARVADAAGLIYVAGHLAVNYGALPKSFDCLEAATRVYRLNRKAAGPLPTNLERLQRLARHPRSIHIDPKLLRSIPDDELRQAPALVRPTRSGALELLLTARQFERRFGKSGAFFRDPEVDAIAIKDGDRRNTAKRTVRTEARQERFYAFGIERSENANDNDEEPASI